MFYFTVQALLFCISVFACIAFYLMCISLIIAASYATDITILDIVLFLEYIIFSSALYTLEIKRCVSTAISR